MHPRLTLYKRASPSVCPFIHTSVTLHQIMPFLARFGRANMTLPECHLSMHPNHTAQIQKKQHLQSNYSHILPQDYGQPLPLWYCLIGCNTIIVLWMVAASWNLDVAVVLWVLVSLLRPLKEEPPRKNMSSPTYIHRLETWNHPDLLVEKKDS